MPAMAFRMAVPTVLVDLRKLPGLDRTDLSEDGLRLGAKVRWCQIENDGRLKIAHPLLVAAISHVAHYQIRNRGTVGGSLAHADPAAEMPGIAVTCDGELTLAGGAGTRKIPAADFFLGPLSTALADDELVVEIRLPAWPPDRRWAFEEFARRRGDFAIAGIAAYYDVDGEGKAENTHIGVIGACERPHRLTEAEEMLNGRRADEATILAVAKSAASGVTPPDDIFASAEYRRSLVETLTERALRRMTAAP